MAMTTTERPIDLDGLTIESIRAGALRGRPVAVLGFARSGIALARFFVDAGAEVTVYDGRPTAELAAARAALDGRPVRLLCGPDAAPADAWRGAALVATSPSINPDYPTAEPRLRAALDALVATRAGGDPSVPALVSRPISSCACASRPIGVTGTKARRRPRPSRPRCSAPIGSIRWCSAEHRDPARRAAPS
jgi:UDP-N-acetylmuramoylalanine-D-glutamate ligase